MDAPLYKKLTNQVRQRKRQKSHLQQQSVLVKSMIIPVLSLSSFEGIFTTTHFYGEHIIQCIVTKVETRKQTGTLFLYKAVMYLECVPFLEKERDRGGPIAPTCPFAL